MEWLRTSVSCPVMILIRNALIRLLKCGGAKMLVTDNWYRYLESGNW